MTTACAYCMGWEGGPHANNCPNYNNPLTQAQALPSQFNESLQQQLNQPNAVQRYLQPNQPLVVWRKNEMTASDLGIVDQLLDDKVGMDLP